MNLDERNVISRPQGRLHSTRICAGFPVAIGQGALRLEDEAGMAILVAFFPNSDDLVYRHMADVVILVLELKDACFNLNYLAAEARRAGANHVNLAIDHFG